MFPFCFFIIWLPPLINRIYEFQGGADSFALDIIQCITMYGKGKDKCSAWLFLSRCRARLCELSICSLILSRRT